MIQQKILNRLFREWGKLEHSALLNIDQRNKRFSFEFTIDKSRNAQRLLKQITELTIKKHPTGTVAFVSYYTGKNLPLSTLYRVFRAEFVDTASKEPVTDDKLSLYIGELEKVLNENAS